MEIGLVTLVVGDYDEAIDFYVDRVGFELLEDEPSISTTTGEPKRWVVVAPPGAETAILLAQAADERQRAAVGNQAGGRVALFLRTDDFETDYQRMVEAGVHFTRKPKRAPYGMVAVWEDLYGNQWDLIEAASAPTSGTARVAYPPAADIGEILIPEDELMARVGQLGAEITADYEGRSPLLVSVLKGSLLFVADLMRAIDGPVEVDFLAVSSYGAATESSGVVRIIKDLDSDVADRDVIVVEDIVDSGLTLRYLLERLSSQRPASLATCSLLVREGSELQVDYEGFRIPPAFVIGYGLDVDQQYRNLPYIATYAGDQS